MVRYDNELELLLDQDLFSAREAEVIGLPPRMVSYYCDKGVFERVDRGYYRPAGSFLDIDPQWEEMVIATKTIPNAVVCLISALCFYGYTDEIMREIWIAIPHARRAPKRNRTRIVRMRNLTLGITEEELDSHLFHITDPERTICDTFRHLDIELAITALRDYIRSIHCDLPKLNSYAKKLKLDLTPYVLTLTT